MCINFCETFLIFAKPKKQFSLFNSLDLIHRAVEHEERGRELRQAGPHPGRVGEGELVGGAAAEGLQGPAQLVREAHVPDRYMLARSTHEGRGGQILPFLPTILKHVSNELRNFLTHCQF